jgi:hypothetical protein
VRRTRLSFLLLSAVLALGACAGSGGGLEASARERCIAGGARVGTPELDACVRDTVNWMEQNRRLQQRIYTQ